MIFSEDVNNKIIDVPLAKCRGLGMFPANLTDSNHPFVKTTYELLNNDQLMPEDCSLASYYDEICPNSASDVLGLSVNHKLSGYHPLSTVLPWYLISPKTQFYNMHYGVYGYHIQHDLEDWTILDGHTQFGPVSKRKLYLEWARLWKLIRGVREHDGFNPDADPLIGSILLDDRKNDWACDIKDGLHRVAVFHAFGFKTLPVRIVNSTDNCITTRSSYKDWLNVKNGYFTTREALRIFDSYMKGKLKMKPSKQDKIKASELADLSISLHLEGKFKEADDALKESLDLVPSMHFSNAPPYKFERIECENNDDFKNQRDVYKVINLLNYSKVTRSDSEKQIFPSYYNISLGSEEIDGQRKPQDRFKYLDMSFVGKSVIDLGCNSGGMIAHIADDLKWSIGLDYDYRLVNAANRSSVLLGHNYSMFYVFDFDKDDFSIIKDMMPHNKADVVFLLSVCPHIKKWEHLIEFLPQLSDTVVFEANGHEHEQFGQIRKLKKTFDDVKILADRGSDGIGARRLLLCQGIK